MTEEKCLDVVLKEVGKTFLMVRWLRIFLPIRGTWVRSLVWEDSTCLRATEPMLHSR